MIHYTLGFVFTPDFTQVLLIHKNRPDWQVGKINGLGGKIEQGETLEACIAREVAEETSLHILTWQSIGEITWQEHHTYIFAGVYDGNPEDACTTTDETIAWYKTSTLPTTIMSNLTYPPVH